MIANRIQAFTSRPKATLEDLWTLASKGKLPTWEVDSKGCFTHLGDASQWKDKAKLKPRVIEKQALLFDLLLATGLDPKERESVRGVYLGRFSGLLITHLGDRFSSIEIVEA